LSNAQPQHRLRRQSLAPALFDPVPAQVRRDQARQLAMVVQPRRHRLQLTADLVPGEEIE
jgi:hypothetical protein